MCVQFYAKAIYATTGPAEGLGHDGQPYTNPDFPIGSIYCEDADGNLYAYHKDPASLKAIYGDQIYTAACWPPRTTKGIQLYRDHWRHIGAAVGAPYTAALLNAPRRPVK